MMRLKLKEEKKKIENYLTNLTKPFLMASNTLFEYRESMYEIRNRVSQYL